MGNNRYAVVDDKAATSGFHVFTMMVDSVSGELTDVRHEGFRSSAIPNRDEEGIALFTPDSTLFISGEHDNAVLEYSLAGQLTGRRLDIPTVIRQAHANQGLEALTYHPASHHFWTVTEAPLAGETSQRLLQFSDSLTCSGQWRYVMDAPQTNKRRGTDVYGVSALTALPDGRLLVLEREFFVAQHYIGSFVTCRLFLIDPLHTAEDAVLPKQLLYIFFVLTHLHLDWCRVICYLAVPKVVKENDNSHRQTNAIADFQLRNAGGFFPYHLIIKLLEQFRHRNVIIKCHDGKRCSKENQHT